MHELASEEQRDEQFDAGAVLPLDPPPLVPPLDPVVPVVELLQATAAASAIAPNPETKPMLRAFMADDATRPRCLRKYAARDQGRSFGFAMIQNAAAPRMPPKRTATSHTICW